MRRKAGIVNALMALAILIIAASPNAHAASQGYFDLENNANDTSGNGRNGTVVGSGPSYLTHDPVALVGSYAAYGFTDANYLSLPATLFTGMQNTGTVKHSIFIRYTDTLARVSMGSNHGADGNFFILWNNDYSITVRIPTSVGLQAFTSALGVYKKGRWYTVFVTWDSGGLQVYLRDNSAGSSTLIIDQTPLSGGGVPKFSASSAIYLGRDSVLTSFSWGAVLDNVEFYDSVVTAETRTENPFHVLMPIGHSYTHSGGGEVDVYRKAALEYWGQTEGNNFVFCGGTVSGTIITPYTSGANGWKAADMEAAITASITAAFPSPSSRCNVLLGPIEWNDANLATDLAAFKTSVRNSIDAVHAYSLDIITFVITGPVTPFVDIMPYVAKVEEAANEAIANGQNVVVIDLNSQSIEISGDNVHPTAAGYGAMGLYVAQGVSENIFPSIPTSTPTHTPTITPTFTPTSTATLTFTATPTITLTPEIWVNVIRVTRTATPTATPVVSQTASPVCSQTPTRSATRTRTNTRTSTRTRTPTRTVTPTRTATPIL